MGDERCSEGAAGAESCWCLKKSKEAMVAGTEKKGQSSETGDRGHSRGHSEKGLLGRWKDVGFCSESAGKPLASWSRDPATRSDFHYHLDQGDRVKMIKSGLDFR